MRLAIRNLLTLILLGSGNTLAHALEIYVLTNDQISGGAANTNFGIVNTTSGNYTSIANLAGDVWNLAWNETAGNFFVTEGTGVATTLRTLSKTGTLSSSLGTIGNEIYGMALRTSNSTLYGYATNDTTGTINTTNGTWATVDANPGTFVAAPNGGRYAILSDTMYLTSKSNSGDGFFGSMGFGNPANYQSILQDNTYGDMVLASDDTALFGVFGNGVASSQRVYSINTSNGSLTSGALIAGSGLGTRFHGAAVPEPSTYALAAIGSGVLAVIARRRKSWAAQAGA